MWISNRGAPGQKVTEAMEVNLERDFSSGHMSFALLASTASILQIKIRIFVTKRERYVVLHQLHVLVIM